MANLPANKEKAMGIMNYIQAKSKSIEELLPKYLTPERMFRIASLALSKQPMLMQCTPQSFVIALMDAAKMGLEPNGIDGALVPYGNQCQFQPMYRGLVKQAIRCGAAKKIEAVLVYQNDKFKFWRDPQPHVEHYPALDDEGEVVAAYAYAVLPDDSIQVEFMNRRQLDHIRSKSKANSGPWITDTEEMLRKTPCKRLFKYLSVSEELEYTVAVDNALETGSNRASVPFVEVTTTEDDKPKKTRTEQIKDSLKATKGLPESPTTDDQPQTNGKGQAAGENAVTAPVDTLRAQLTAKLEELGIPPKVALADYQADVIDDLTEGEIRELLVKLEE